MTSNHLHDAYCRAQGTFDTLEEAQKAVGELQAAQKNYLNDKLKLLTAEKEAKVKEILEGYNYKVDATIRHLIVPGVARRIDGGTFIPDPSVQYHVTINKDFDAMIFDLDNLIKKTSTATEHPMLRQSVDKLIMSIHQMIEYAVDESPEVKNYNDNLCKILRNYFKVEVINSTTAMVFDEKYFDIYEVTTVKRSFITSPALIESETGKVICKGAMLVPYYQ